MTEKTMGRRPRKPRSLVATLVIAFSGLSAVVLLISGGLQLFTNFQTQQQVIISRQRFIAEDASKTVSAFVEDNFSTLDAAARVADLINSSSEQVETTLRVIYSLQPAIRQSVYLNNSRAEVASTSLLAPKLSERFVEQFRDEALFEQIEARQRYISPIYIDEITSEPLIAMAVPISDVFGDIQGVLVVELNLKFMWDLVDNLHVGETGFAYVVDDKGDLIAFRDTSLVLRAENLAHLASVANFVAGQDPFAAQAERLTISSGITGENVVALFVPLSTVSWAVVTELPWLEAYRELIVSSVWSLVITLGMAILAGLIGIVVARRLAAPIVELSTVAIRVGAGNLSLQAEVTGPAETATLAQTFNDMTTRLRDLFDSLEQRVADRTKALATSAEVSRRLSTILDPEQLVAEVVDQVRSAFDYYHVHIYLYDENQRDLRMVAGSGEAGQAMLEKGHRVEMEQGLVGRAAATKLVVLVADVSQESGWLPNPLLPETKTEIAVPIAIGDTLLGVLDVQDAEIGALDQDDAGLLQSISNQVAVALRNTQSYQAIQRRAEREAYFADINQQIQRTTSIDEALKVAAREVGRALGKETSVRIKSQSNKGG